MAKGMVKTKDSMHTTANVFSADMFSPGSYKASFVDEFSSFILVDYLSPDISGYVCMYVCMYIYVYVYICSSPCVVIDTAISMEALERTPRVAYTRFDNIAHTKHPIENVSSPAPIYIYIYIYIYRCICIL
jgi:hypothetical protein